MHSIESGTWLAVRTMLSQKFLSFLRAVTNLGDVGVTLPLAIALIVLLWHAESVRAAWYFARAMLGCMIVMTLLKIIFISCGGMLAVGVISPSGHSALSTVLYGSMAAIAWGRFGKGLRALAALTVLTAALLIGLILVSRVLLHQHSVREVICGFLVGALWLLAFTRPYLALPHPVMRLWRGALVLGAITLLTYGSILPAERMLRDYVPWFRICT